MIINCNRAIHFSTNAGPSGKSPNLYVYAFNSPLILKDPTGRIPVFLVSSGVSALASVASYTVVTVASGDSFSTGGK